MALYACTRLTLGLCGVLLAGMIEAAGSYPVPVHIPDIEHPRSLSFSPEPISISLRIMIRKDGTVHFIELLDNTDPPFIAKTKATVERWRFEPWTPPASSPEGEILTVTYNYVNTPDKQQSLNVNVEIKKWLCHDLNQAVRKSNDQWWDKRFQDVSLLRITRNYLAEGHVMKAFVSEADRHALILELVEATPTVVSKCKAAPMSKYVDALPHRVRAML